MEYSPPSQAKTTNNQEYESLFREWPRGLSGWLLRLDGKPWYDDIFRWYIEKLTYPKPSFVTAEFLVGGLPGIKWQPTDPILKLVTSRLAVPCLKNIPDLYIGQYNDHHIWLALL